MIHLDAKNGSKSLAPLLSVINRNTVLPVLECFAVKRTIDGVEFSSTDLETVVKTTINGQTHSGIYSFCVPAKKLSHLLKSSLSESISLSLAKNEESINIVMDGCRVTIPTQAIKNYPVEPLVDRSRKVTLNWREMSGALKRAMAFVSHDDLRPGMTGVCLSDRNGVIEIAATDGFMLFWQKLTLTPGNLKGIHKIMSAKACRCAIQLMAGEEEVEFSYDDNVWSLKAGGKEIISRFIDARYPDIHMVIPQKSTVEFCVDRKKLKAFLTLAIPFTDVDNKIRLKIYGDKIMVDRPMDKFDAYSVGYTIPITHMPKSESKNPDYSIWVNAKFLNKIISLDNDGAVLIKHNGDGEKPIVIDEKYLIMPIMVTERQ